MANFSPLRYPGGKGKTYKYIRYLVQENNIRTYIEPFAGGSSVGLTLLINGDVDRIIINDIDFGIYALWYTIKNNSDALINLIENTEITMNEWYKQKEIQKEKDSSNSDLLKLAFSTLFLNRTNRSGIIKAGVIGGKKQNGKYKLDCRFNKEKIIKRIQKISELSNNIEVYNLDAKDFIKEVIINTENSFTFFDPPYYVKGPELYTNFYTHKDHIELSDSIKKFMKNHFWIITYDITDEIKDLYQDFKHYQYYLNYSIAKPSKGLEYIFFSSNLEPGPIDQFLQIISPTTN